MKSMLEYHIEKGADVTISVIEVPWDEASQVWDYEYK